jgi:hypothetical protein
MKILVTILTVLTFASCGQQTDTKQVRLTLYNSDYSSASTLKYSLSDSQLVIAVIGELVGEKDSILFRTTVRPSYALSQLADINSHNLHEYYENPCIRDGSQIRVELDSDYEKKIIQLSNYYQEDIGLVIEFINRSIPKEYKIWYDKAILQTALKDCK